MRAVNVQEAGGWGPAIREAVARRGESTVARLQRDGLVICISPEELKEIEDDDNT